MKNQVTEARKKLKMTQEELADKVDVTRQTIISLEQGRYNPSLLLAHRITKVLKKRHIEDLFEFDEDSRLKI
jgi:putative transcriptional regulator